MDDSQEDADRLSPQELAARLSASHTALRLSPEDERRREIALSLADGNTWRKTASSCVVHFVESYRLGEIDMQGVMSDMRRVVVGCLPQERVWILGLTALLSLEQTPVKKKRGHHPPKWPLWLKNATADLVLHQKANNPSLRRSPYDYSREGIDSSSATSLALDILTKTGWFGDRPVPTLGTIDDWVRARLKEGGAGAAPPPSAP